MLRSDELPSGCTIERIKEIAEFHETIYNDILNSSTTDELEYSVISARIEDQIFFEFEVELEEVAPFFKASRRFEE